METPLLVLIHSPLVGLLTWRGCAAELQSRGHRTLVPSLAGVTDGAPPWIPRLAGRVAEAIEREAYAGDVVVVVHSGAGTLVPAMTRAIPNTVRAAMFVDAVLPSPGRSRFEVAPPALCKRLRELAREGLLPPWSEWFPPESLAEHLPEEVMRRRFVAELPMLPLAYFEEREPEVNDWERVSCGYVRLSEAYDEAARVAESRGWRTVHIASDHLGMVTQPKTIATAIEELLVALGVRR